MSTPSPFAPARLPVLLLLATLALSVGLNGYLLVAAGEDDGRVREVRDNAPTGLHAELVRTRAALRACQTDSVFLVGTGAADNRSGAPEPGPAAVPVVVPASSAAADPAAGSAAESAADNSFVTSSQ